MYSRGVAEHRRCRHATVRGKRGKKAALTKDGRWTAVGKEPSDKKKTVDEKHAFKFMENISKAVAEAGQPFMPDNRPQVTTLVNNPNGVPKCINRKNSTRPDSYWLILDYAKPIPWADVVCPAEYKKAKNDQNAVNDVSQVSSL